MGTTSLEQTRLQGGYYHTQSDRPGEAWHLRFGVTPNCNFYCTYCAPEGGFPKQGELSLKEVGEILEAAFKNGVKRVHWTGGEPTYRRDIRECMQYAKDLGYVEQIITTNGYRLRKILDDCIESGLSRVIVSLDTLDADRFQAVTGMNLFKSVLGGLEDAVHKLTSPTKMSCCVMKSTLPELPDFISYASALNSRPGNAGHLIVKLNQIFPSNPAQLQQKGSDYWKREVVSEQEIIACLSNIGNLHPVPRTSVLGDNPSYNYFRIGNPGVTVGILAMYTWRYKCGGCHKLRVKPNGQVSVCMDYPDADIMLAGKPLNEKIEMVRKAMYFREHDLEVLKPISERFHYTEQLGSQRFGALGNPKKMEAFYKG